jgi:hypothetical protein
MMMTNTRSFDQPQHVVDALETEESSRGKKAAFDLALELLSHELNHLEWQPPIGVALGRWVTSRQGVPATLLHSIASYLQLYYPELDESLAEIQQRFATGRVEEGHQLLAAALDGMTP